MISSVKHKINETNAGKRAIYLSFLCDYSDYACKVHAHVVRFGYQDFSIKAGKLDFPKYIDYKDFDFIKTPLSARARSSAVGQVSGLIRASVEKQRRVNWVRTNKNPNVKNKKFTMPKMEKIYPNLSSKCCDFCKTNDGKFFGFIRLKSLGNKYGNFNIPVSFSRKIDGDLKSGFIFRENHIQACYEEKTSPTIKGNKVIAIDQGLLSIATCSDSQVSPDLDNHNHSLSSILDKISRKKKGSKAFKKAIAHRKNFVNWSINKLNFDGVKEVRLEKVVNIRFGKKSSRKMSHWSNPEIRDKIKRRCEKLEVPVIEQSCSYRSQRCSQCGQVRKANRKGKIYSCKNCGCSIDADYNASLNHLVDLPDVPRAFLGRKLNLGDGFFWLASGFTLKDGSELRVPDSQN